jgi:trans-aconitate methyltransferase
VSKPGDHGIREQTAGSSAWRGDEYAPHARHHRYFDDWFLARHAPPRDAIVVDAGCGTGDFTLQLAGLVPEGCVIGVEPDPSMLREARVKTTHNLEFRQGRLQELDEICDASSADLVVSRAVFHWIPLSEYERSYAAVFGVLKPGGWFHAESGATGNVRQVRAVLDKIAASLGLAAARVTFPDAGTVLELLELAGFRLADGAVTTVAQRRHFDRDGLLGFVRTQAVQAYVADSTPGVREEFLAEVERHLDLLRRHDGTYDQTFVRLDVLCQRPGPGQASDVVGRELPHSHPLGP